MYDSLEHGTMLRCPVCGAEITVLAWRGGGSFQPRCCNVKMELLPQKAIFFKCEICKAEIAAINDLSRSDFTPICCNRQMIKKAVS